MVKKEPLDIVDFMNTDPALQSASSVSTPISNMEIDEETSSSSVGTNDKSFAHQLYTGQKNVLNYPSYITLNRTN